MTSLLSGPPCFIAHLSPLHPHISTYWIDDHVKHVSNFFPWGTVPATKHGHRPLRSGYCSSLWIPRLFLHISLRDIYKVEFTGLDSLLDVRSQERNWLRKLVELQIKLKYVMYSKVWINLKSSVLLTSYLLNKSTFYFELTSYLKFYFNLSTTILYIYGCNVLFWYMCILWND